MKLPLLFLFLSASLASADHFANGVKIGEVSDDSAVIWTRLTENAEADNRVVEWDEKDPHWRVPGKAGEIKLEYWVGEDRDDSVTEQLTAVAEDDFCVQFKLDELKPATTYNYHVGTEETGIGGKFTTAPAKGSEKPLTFTVSTCQDFPRRDDKANGHVIYKSMLAQKPSFFVQTGDTLYYDKAKPFAKDMATARYKWHRLYALPYFRNFHSQVPSYWIHDDHDVLKDDCWPGQKYGDLTFDQGIKIWKEQIPQSDKPYRTFRWGKNLQIWLPEGREFRSPNDMPDGPEKTILGKEQWKWLEKTMRESDATFKLYISATPVVGPDRVGKKDNHANQVFHHEGERLRKFLRSIPGCFVVNGDRHWQYHSIDPKTGLNEPAMALDPKKPRSDRQWPLDEASSRYGVDADTLHVYYRTYVKSYGKENPASDEHAGGWKMSLQEDWQDFLRIKGGYLSVEVTGEAATVRHHAVDGEVVHEKVIAAPAVADE